MLVIIASYCCMQSQRKLMNKTWENGKNPSFGPDFDPFGPNLGSKFFFWWILPLLNVRHCSKLSLYAISRKTNEPNLRKWQKNPPSFWPDFGHFGPQKCFSLVLNIRHIRHCCKLSLYAISRKTKEPNLRKWQKT